MRRRHEYIFIFNLLYNLLNKNNIRLGNVDMFLHRINHPDQEDVFASKHSFKTADIESIIQDFFDQEHPPAEVTRGLFLILNICAKTGQERFMTGSLLHLVHRKFEGSRRESLLRTYLAVFASLFAQVGASNGSST